MKKYIAELIGTFTLVFCGCGAIVTNEFSNGTVTHSGIALTFGLVVMSLIYAFGEISGAHFNPAVTIAFTYAKKFPLLNSLNKSLVFFSHNPFGYLYARMFSAQ